MLLTIMKVSPTSCLCPVLLCLCFLERSYGAIHHGQTRMVSSSHNLTHSHNHTKDGKTEVHHRPKRGWIWNQFFVLEEHIGPDAQYVGKVSNVCLLYLFCTLKMPLKDLKDLISQMYKKNIKQCICL